MALAHISPCCYDLNHATGQDGPHDLNHVPMFSMGHSIPIQRCYRCRRATCTVSSLQKPPNTSLLPALDSLSNRNKEPRRSEPGETSLPAAPPEAAPEAYYVNLTHTTCMAQYSIHFFFFYTQSILDVMPDGTMLRLGTQHCLPDGVKLDPPHTHTPPPPPHTHTHTHTAFCCIVHA